MSARCDFSFDCCENCESLEPYVDVKRVYVHSEVAETELVIRCDNDKKCRELYHMLKQQLDNK